MEAAEAGWWRRPHTAAMPWRMKIRVRWGMIGGGEAMLHEEGIGSKLTGRGMATAAADSTGFGEDDGEWSSCGGRRKSIEGRTSLEPRTR